MLAITPLHPQAYIYSQDAFLDADYYEFMTRQAAEEYAVARARLEAIERQRARDFHPRHWAPNHVHLPFALLSEACYHQRVPQASQLPFISAEDPALGVWREERRRNLLPRQHKAQQPAFAEVSACQEDENRARAFQAQRLREQERQEAERRARAQEAQRKQNQDALLALLTLVTQVASQVQTQQPDPSSRLQSAPISVPEPVYKPVDRKGKGRAIEVPAVSTTASMPASTTWAEEVPTFKEELEARIRNEIDPDVQESLVLLYFDLFDTRDRFASGPIAGPSKPRETRVRVSVPVEESAPSDTPALSEESKSPPQPASETQSRAAVAPVSHILGHIEDVEIALRKLEEAFIFPERLDFVAPVPSDAASIDSKLDEPRTLAYTPNNTPVHAYEHALNALLTRLDAVESHGDLEVRGRRKEVVKAVERALEGIERRVEESRERERERCVSLAFPVETEVTLPVPGQEEVIIEEASTVIEPTPVTKSAPISQDTTATSTVVIDVAVKAQEGSSHFSDSTTSDITAAESPTVNNAPSNPPTSDTPDSAAKLDDTQFEAFEATLDSVLEVSGDASVAAAQVDGPAVVTEEASLGISEDDTEEVTSEVPLVPSASEYILPPVFISSPDTRDIHEGVALSDTIENVSSTIVAADSPSQVSPDLRSDGATLLVMQDTPSSSVLASESIARAASLAPSASTDGDDTDSFSFFSSPPADKLKALMLDAGYALDEVEVISKEDLAVPARLGGDSDWTDLDSEH